MTKKQAMAIYGPDYREGMENIQWACDTYADPARHNVSDEEIEATLSRTLEEEYAAWAEEVRKNNAPKEGNNAPEADPTDSLPER